MPSYKAARALLAWSQEQLATEADVQDGPLGGRQLSVWLTPFYLMQSATARPGPLLQVAASSVFENVIVPPGHVTETSFSPGLQTRLQPLSVSQVSSLNA